MFLRRQNDHREPALEWGIRERLTAYVADLRDGVVAVDGLAQFVPNTHPPRFRFPQTASDSDTARYAGTVQIVGHRGLLRISASDPWLEFDEQDAELSLSPDDGATRIVVARVPAFSRASTAAATARLTAAGAAWLGPTYAEGDEASAVTIRLASLPRRQQRSSPHGQDRRSRPRAVPMDIGTARRRRQA